MNPQDAASAIYNQALQGSDNNPGVPPIFAEFMVGQAGDETNGFTSDFFANNKNCFGYECDPSSRYQNGCSSSIADNGVSVGNYDTIEDSAMEVIDWWYRRTSDGRGGCPSSLDQITSSDQYAQILSSAGYYTSSERDYLSNINKWIGKFTQVFHKR